MSRQRAERLVNLTLCLMSSETRLWTAEDVRTTVPGYDHPDTPEGNVAFRRAFERDKDELRGLGFPLLTAPTWTGVDGYRIPRRDAFLPDIHLDPDEARAVALAVGVWRSGSLARSAAAAWTKLRTAGAADGAPFTELPVGPRLDAADPTLDPLMGAVRDGRVVHFAYHSGGAPGAKRRTVEPWGLRAVKGRWYLLGRDRDKDAPRVFRLSRIEGPVRAIGAAGAVRRPDSAELDAQAARIAGDAPGPERVAVLRLRPGRANAIRRASRELTERENHTQAELPFRDVRRTAQLIAAFGADAVVLQPPDLRDEVIGLLRATAGSHGRIRTEGAVR